MAGAPKENTNAETWTLDESKDLFNKAMDMVYNKVDYTVMGKTVKGFEYHFLGEIATSEKIRLYPDVFKYLKGKFEELRPVYNRLKATLEANCFSDSKKGIINTATAIMNLKSNYGWTDRLDQTSKNEKIQPPILNIDPLSKDE